ncbi:ATP-binding protein [Magnetospira sp. QH-2]|uniref:ATP-binding protein n=1 Tax=Magnetospira sp. (strain QH-2) TaxID=1288970 RepID=UPI0003E81235|nr:ATP-binding protein [Magnetospira sp. QH-2]CCQ74501.1 putative Sensor protein [Magnetospira sp. QH-2]
MNDRIRIGIRGRLFSAFGVTAMATLAATVVAWVSFSRLGDALDEVVGSSVPAVTFAAELAEHGGGIIGAAPALAAAQTDTERDQAWTALVERLNGMSALLDVMPEAAGGESFSADLREDVAALRGNLKQLNTVVSQRLARAVRKEELNERLRWASADFLDEIEPMIDDTRFNIDLNLSRAATEPHASRRLPEALTRQRALFTINADGSLMAELIGRAANLPTADALRGTELYYLEIESRIDASLRVINKVPGALSLRQSIKDLQAFAHGPEGLFELRRHELGDIESEGKLLNRNQSLLLRLDRSISQRVAAENHAALQAAERSQDAIRQGRLWLAISAFVSVFVAVPVVWLYVGEGLVARIRRLDASMRIIAEGDLSADVPVSGTDEIGDMANSLRTFRDTLSVTQAELVQAAKLAALGQLTAGISHEINQPLAAIRHYTRNTGLLVDKGRTEEARENLDRITHLVEKSNRIIGSLRDLARKPKRDLRPTDMVKVIEDVLTLLERRVWENKVEIDTRIDDDCRYVLAGQVRLEQVVLNLVNNAIDAMQNEPVRRLIISAQPVDEWIDFRVRDTGSGIPETEITKIFDPFFTTKQVGEGLGLGLSVSYNIVRDFGGSLRVESVEDHGATFWIRLKRASQAGDGE